MTALKYFRKLFPEDLYPTELDKQPEYMERLLYGYEKAADSTVFIAGLARDIEDTIHLTIPRLEHLASFFYDAGFIIIENDSKDNTSQSLLSWKTEYPKFISSKKLNLPRFGSIKNEQRIKQMTYLRTNLQNTIRAFNDECRTDYVILLDLDILGGFSYDGILNSLSYNFDAISSNSLYYQDGKRHFYDTYALRLEDEKDAEEKQSLLFNRGEKPIKVLSGFGGLCIYKMDSYLNGVYHTDDSSQWCEHQGFHKNMNCYLNPSQITLYNRTRYCI